MRHMQSLVVSVVTLAVVGVVAPGSAHAQAVPGPASESKLWLGGQLGLSPIGTLNGESPGTSVSADASTAFELGGRVEYQVTPLIAIGFAPALGFRIKGKADNDSAWQLDLPLRVAVGGDVMPELRVYGFAAPGYTFLFVPSDLQGDSMTASGFMIGFGGGAAYRIAPKLALSGELGYQFRFPSGSLRGTDVSYQANYLTLTVAATVGF